MSLIEGFGDDVVVFVCTIVGVFCSIGAVYFVHTAIRRPPVVHENERRDIDQFVDGPAERLRIQGRGNVELFVDGKWLTSHS